MRDTKAFIDDIVEVYKKHGLTIAHFHDGDQDYYETGFIIRNYAQEDIDDLEIARVEIEDDPSQLELDLDGCGSCAHCNCLHIPNEETIAAIHEAENCINTRTFNEIEEMFEDLESNQI